MERRISLGKCWQVDGAKKVEILFAFNPRGEYLIKTVSRDNLIIKTRLNVQFGLKYLKRQLLFSGL